MSDQGSRPPGTRLRLCALALLLASLPLAACGGGGGDDDAGATETQAPNGDNGGGGGNGDGDNGGGDGNGDSDNTGGGDTGDNGGGDGGLAAPFAIPDLFRLDPDDLANALRTEDYCEGGPPCVEVAFQEEPSDTTAPGEVIRIDPPVGALVERGDTVTIFVAPPEDPAGPTDASS